MEHDMSRASKPIAKPVGDLTKASKGNAIELIEGGLTDGDLDQASGGKKHLGNVKYDDITVTTGTSTVKVGQS